MSGRTKAGEDWDGAHNHSGHPYVMEVVYTDGKRLWVSAETEQQALWNLHCASQYTRACFVYERATDLMIAQSSGPLT